MAEITKPMALDESLNTTESSPRNIADVLAQGIGNLVTVVSRISQQTVYDELDKLNDVNVTSPADNDVLKYNSTTQKWENGQGGGGSSCEELIAPVETSTTASQAYAIGEQFILNGTLYTATAAITAGGTITIDGNCTASDSVTEQIQSIKQGESIYVTTDGVKTWLALLNALFALVDSTKINVRSVLVYKNDVYACANFQLGNTYLFTGNNNISNQKIYQKRIALRSTNSSADEFSNTTYTNLTTTVPASGDNITVYY